MNIIFAAIFAISISASALAAEGALSPPASTEPDKQGQMIDQVLSVSGMKKTLLNLSAQTAAGFMQDALGSGASALEQDELHKVLEEALPRDVFVKRVSAVLKKNYNEQRYAHFLQLLSSPLAARLLQLEEQQPDPADVQTFLAQVSERPLQPERIKLIRRMDEVTRSSELLIAMTIASIEARALAAGDDCSAAEAKIKRAIADNRAEIEKASRSRVQIMLAFIYRNVLDADLGAYLKIYEDKDSSWVEGMAKTAIEDQFRVSVAKGAQGLKKIIRAHKPRKTMFAPRCGQSESPAEEALYQEELAKRPLARSAAPSTGKAATAVGTQEARHDTSQPNIKSSSLNKQVVRARPTPVHSRDLRYCLELATSAEIIACANQ